MGRRARKYRWPCRGDRGRHRVGNVKGSSTVTPAVLGVPLASTLNAETTIKSISTASAPVEAAFRFSSGSSRRCLRRLL
jgi:hypothetical protein